MKLELKHLAPYLPYSLNTKYQLSGVIGLITPQKDEIRDKILRPECVPFVLKYCQPILRPLSDLTEEHANNCNYSHRDFKWEIINQNVPIKIWNDLLNNHWDVFGLIEKGLAIDINTLNK